MSDQHRAFDPTRARPQSSDPLPTDKDYPRGIRQPSDVMAIVRHVLGKVKPAPEELILREFGVHLKPILNKNHMNEADVLKAFESFAIPTRSLDSYANARKHRNKPL